ncbi:MAG TPA: hypothetical protein VNA24_25140 [Hyalangium sp.]|nr:hypothetical protein [Hyalangium sp.]
MSPLSPSGVDITSRVEINNSEVYKSTAIDMASAMVAERQDGTRIFLRYFPTGEIQQWSKAKEHWVMLGTCAPAASSLFHQTAPQCREGSIQLLRE